MQENIVAEPSRPTLGISSCLIGQKVRFDGGHKQNSYILKTLAEHFEFAPFCPERGIGLPAPRKAIRLVSTHELEGTQAIEVNNPDKVFTSQLDDYGRKVAAQIQHVSGYIVKKDSPSCGMERVKIYGKENFPPERNGVGVFTARLMKELPTLPVEEEGRLMDPRLRENFITRVYTLARWQNMMAAGLTRQGLVKFHTRHKFLLLAHHEVTYRELGRMISDVGNGDLASVASEYLLTLMTGLRNLSTPGKRVNVLMHIMGFIKDRMTAEEKEELLDLIESHRLGLLPMIGPIILLNHFLRRYPHEYIEDQYFLTPHPRELMLNNTI